MTTPENRHSKQTPRNPWLGVELRHLAALLAVAREGSFRGAADSLGYVQSAVSQQLAQLERVAGQRLVERARGSAVVTITPAGQLLCEHAETIFSHLGAAQADLETLGGGGAGRLRIGACSSLATGIFPKVLPRLLAGAPTLRVEAVEAPAADLAARVADGSLDAAFAELPLPAGRFEHTDLCVDPYLLLALPTSLPSPSEPLTGDELMELPLIEHELMRSVEPRMRAVGIAPQYALRCGSLSALATLVAADAGCAIVPRLLGAERDERLVATPLDHILPPRRICVFWHSGRERSQAVEQLVEVARFACGPLGRDRAIRPLDQLTRTQAAA
jgi:DNA-binding transcriptional LysR family regulator